VGYQVDETASPEQEMHNSSEKQFVKHTEAISQKIFFMVEV
jgi:hypothetical protein